MPEIVPRPSVEALPGGAVLSAEMVNVLSAIERCRSLTGAAKQLGMSYRHVWSLVKGMETIVGRRLLVTKRGGRGGGGMVTLTGYASKLLREYRVVTQGLERVAMDDGFWQSVGLKLSVRNRMKGIVKSVTLGEASAKVVVEVGGPVVLTSLITREAAEELHLRAGDRVEALVKSTEVIILKRGSTRPF